MALKGIAAQTPEQRAENLEKAKIAQRAKQAARKASPLRRDFADSPHWDRLTSALGVRLPPWGEAPSTTVMRQFLNRIGRSGAWYLEHSGERQLSDFAKANPAWPARAWAGICLEWHAADSGTVVPEQEAMELEAAS